MSEDSVSEKELNPKTQEFEKRKLALTIFAIASIGLIHLDPHVPQTNDTMQNPEVRIEQTTQSEENNLSEVMSKVKEVRDRTGDFEGFGEKKNLTSPLKENT